MFNPGGILLGEVVVMVMRGSLVLMHPSAVFLKIFFYTNLKLCVVKLASRVWYKPGTKRGIILDSVILVASGHMR